MSTLKSILYVIIIKLDVALWSRIFAEIFQQKILGLQFCRNLPMNSKNHVPRESFGTILGGGGGLIITQRIQNIRAASQTPTSTCKGVLCGGENRCCNLNIRLHLKFSSSEGRRGREGAVYQGI